MHPIEAGLEGLAAAARADTDAGQTASVAAPRAVIESGSRVDIGNLFVFGDSYSRLKRKRFPNWAEQLQGGGYAGNLRGFAISGAQANSASSIPFSREISKWRNSGIPFRSSDATVVYFGYNDIDSATTTFNPSRAGYTSGMQALVAKGANDAGRKIYVVMPHDWGSVPAYNRTGKAGDLRAKTKLWDSFVKSLPNKYANTVAVDLFTPIDRVLADPGQYGFNNVKTADPGHSATTALYDDDYHFGQHGQKIIEQTMLNYMSRSAEYANGLAMTAKLQSRRQGDVADGLALGLAALDEEQALGVTAFPVGISALPQAPQDGDRSRAQFSQAFNPDQRDGGAGLNYALPDGTMFGMTFSSYDDATDDQRRAGLATSSVRSDAISFYLDQKLGAFEVGTDLFYSKDRHQKVEYDEVAGQHDRAGFDGRTVSLSERLGYPVRHQGMVLTPWAGVSYQMQQVDGFTIANPFVSDQTYSDTQVADTLASIGLDARLDPIALGEGANLTLFGGLSYTHGLIQDDYKVKIKEAAFDNVQEETIDRPQTRTIGLNLGGSLHMGNDLSLDAGVGIDHDLATGTAEAGRVGVTYRFF